MSIIKLIYKDINIHYITGLYYYWEVKYERKITINHEQ